MYSIMPYASNIARRACRDLMGDTFFRGLFDGELTNGFRVDIKDEGDKYLLTADLPGVNKEDINVSVENGTLTISAKIDSENEEKADNYVRRERRYGNFSRGFSLDGIDENTIEANYTNGVLSLTLNKLAEEKPEKKMIAIS